jgi:glucose-1-phosphate cytidylyltransferase
VKCAILTSGLGSRLGEETRLKPKALVEIGERPILEHIMARYAAQGFNDFVIDLGHMGDEIKRHFLDQTPSGPEPRVVPSPGFTECPNGNPANVWQPDLVDTGQDTQSGGRIKRRAPHLGGATFMLTWCDGLADIDFHALLAFHLHNGRLATLTAVRPPPRGRNRLRTRRIHQPPVRTRRQPGHRLRPGLAAGQPPIPGRRRAALRRGCLRCPAWHARLRLSLLQHDT